MIWASLLAALLKRSLTHFAEASLGVELSTQRAAASGKHYFDDVLRGLLDSPRQLRRALAEALKFLDSNARRAHPARDRKRGRRFPGRLDEVSFGRSGNTWPNRETSSPFASRP
jgi:hypothetical protein